MTDSPLRITIDLSALSRNYQTLRAVSGTDVAGVVKANAYGIGIEHVVPTLHDLGCPVFFVATVQEAMQVRLYTNRPIAVLGGGGVADDPDIWPVLNSASDVAHWAAHGNGRPCILHIDTGMNRLGITPPDFDAVRGALPTLNLRYVMSHFACSDEPAHEMTARQNAAFLAAIDALKLNDVPKSLANSGGVFADKNPYAYDLVRPGIALYGGHPFGGVANNPVAPVVRIDARVLQVRDVRAGDTIGYSATHRFDAPARTATLGIGYADGYKRSLSGRGIVFVNGTACPVVGRVSMDLTCVDVTALPAPVQQGDWVEIIGPSHPVDAAAAEGATISYELLTQLSRRAQRVVAL